jgi:hypothetical protein
VNQSDSLGRISVGINYTKKLQFLYVEKIISLLNNPGLKETEYPMAQG